MSTKDKWKWAYKVVRSVLFTIVAFIAFIYGVLYVVLSLPPVQEKVRTIAQQQLTLLTGGDVAIGKVEIYPFNEVVVKDVNLNEPGSGLRCLHVDEVGAGISLWNLVRHGKIIITYAELIGPDIKLRQNVKDGDLNIQFLIDAFKPKDKNKPPAKFDLQIRNIVLRKGLLSFNKMWAPRSEGKFDADHLRLEGLSADVSLPRLSNDVIEIDVRRLAFKSLNGFRLKNLEAQALIDHKDINLKNINIEFPSGDMKIADINLPLSKYSSFSDFLAKGLIDVSLDIKSLSPADFSSFLPALENIHRKFDISVRASGNKNRINVESFSLKSYDNELNLKVKDFALSLQNGGLKDMVLKDLSLKSTASINASLAESLLQSSDVGLADIFYNAGNLNLSAEGFVSVAERSGKALINLESGFGDVDIDAKFLSENNIGHGVLNVNSNNFNVGRIVENVIAGVLTFSLNADVEINELQLASLKGWKRGNIIDLISQYSRVLPSANIKLNLPSADINGYNYKNLNFSLEKRGGDTGFELISEDENFNMNLAGDILLAGADSKYTLNGEILKLNPSAAGLITGGDAFTLSGDFDINLDGDNLDNLVGEVGVRNLHFLRHDSGKELSLNNLRVNSIIEENNYRFLSIDSDWLGGTIKGNFTPGNIPLIVRNLASEALPTLLPPASSISSYDVEDSDDILDFDFTVFRNGSWVDFLNLPVKLLYECRIKGAVDSSDSEMNVSVDAPFIQQGKDKLIRNTRLSATVRNGKADVNAYSSIPTKKGILDLAVGAGAGRGLIDLNLQFNPGSQGAFYGDLQLQAKVSPALNDDGREINLTILPSKAYLNGAAWNIGETHIDYAEGQIRLSGFSVSHDNQFVAINGVASPSEEDEIIARLNDINLDYIFDTLNIDVAQFGGSASGEAVGRALLSKDIEAFTRNLKVKNLSYNGTVLGDGNLRGDFDIKQKRVGIYADIYEDGRFAANVDGGIWVGKDSLSFNFDADKVRVGFLKYFMKAFASEVDGRASGKANLYGTFHDVDMKGRFFADTVRIKVGYTNVTYSGSDSIIINPGKINVDKFKLHDDYGHTATLSGTLTHDYFHKPEFDFRVTDAYSLLLYDTNAQMNPVWHGRIFGTGSGRIAGNDDYVHISADMTADSGSDFTFMLDDSKEALNYGFLTFTDKRKAAMEIAGEKQLTEEEEIVKAFEKTVARQQGPPSIFAMDIRATITPGVKMTLVMDPVAGDKIVARGSGPVQIGYDSASNEMKMYGKYTLSEGIYNFSLQDLILKDFIIKEGSSVSFNGDPMAATLNIRAAYRVNTNLTDLDMSFATDKDVNRVNVPVDAMLLVSGEMEHPDIKFDIELPTLNSETEQKVRSIISSEDMMNTQMIYLLALNRFYTPEYNGNGNSGGEWASVASSTISSQLQNILGQMTDKVTIAPSLRSDKGDFSDLQVDVALSSRLFNNRLLINGNLGYRDPSTSSTTFIGDFDLEYLLNRSGNFRLKAYNHFNDQNYYLKSALTTQGIGVVWRHDFDRLFKRRKKELLDSIPTSFQN